MTTLKIGKHDIDENNFYKQNSLEVEGDIVIAENLDYVRFHTKLTATGCILAKAGTGIEAGTGIKAGEGIKAGLGIKAGEGIEAGTGIEAGLSIVCKSLSSKLRIFAGLCLWRLPKPEEKQIVCKKLLQGEICFGELIIKKDE